MAEGCGFEIRQAPQGVRGFKSLHLRQDKLTNFDKKFVNFFIAMVCAIITVASEI